MSMLGTEVRKTRMDLVGASGMVTRDITVVSANRNSLGEVDIRVTDNMGNNYSTSLDADVELYLTDKEIQSLNEEEFVGLQGTVTRQIEVKEAHENERGEVTLRISDSMGNVYSTSYDEQISLEV